jgi:hypothetical protein
LLVSFLVSFLVPFLICCSYNWASFEPATCGIFRGRNEVTLRLQMCCLLLALSRPDVLPRTVMVSCAHPHLLHLLFFTAVHCHSLLFHNFARCRATTSQMLLLLALFKITATEFCFQKLLKKLLHLEVCVCHKYYIFLKPLTSEMYSCLKPRATSYFLRHSLKGVQ